MDASEKQKLRREMRARLAALSPAGIAAASQKILGQITNEPAWFAAPRILAFVPLPGEPLLLDALFQCDKIIALPCTTAHGLIFREISDRSCLLPRTLSGTNNVLWEPDDAACPHIEPNQNDLALVPGLGFTEDGKRLGRGGGYYDRFLADFPGQAWGVCFAIQLLENLPTEPHDVRVKRVIFASA